MAGGIVLCSVQQLVDRIIGLSPQPRDQLAARLPGTEKHPVQQRLRRLVIGEAQHLAQSLRGLNYVGIPATAKMVPERHLVGPVAMIEQLLLGPAHDGRHEQIGQTQIVQRLGGEADRRHQVFYREWRTQTQPVHTGNRNTSGMQAGDDQSGKLAPLAHQDHHVAWSGVAAGAFYQREALVHPALHLCGNAIGHSPLGFGNPAFRPLAFTAHIALLLVLIGLCRDRAPQGDKAGPVVTTMPVGRIGQTELSMSDCIYGRIHEIENRLRRAIGSAKAEIQQFARGRGLAQSIGTACSIRHDLREMMLGNLEVFGTGPLKPENRLLVIADDENGSQDILALPRPGEEIFRQGTDDGPLRLIGILCLVDQDMIEPPVELVADPVGDIGPGQQGCSPADLVVEIHQPFAGLRLVPGNCKAAADFQRRSQPVGKFHQLGAHLHGIEGCLQRLSRCGILRILLLQRLEAADIPALREEGLRQIGAERRASARFSRQPLLPGFCRSETGLGAPRQIRRYALPQRFASEGIVIAKGSEIFRTAIGIEA